MSHGLDSPTCGLPSPPDICAVEETKPRTFSVAWTPAPGTQWPLPAGTGARKTIPPRLGRLLAAALFSGLLLGAPCDSSVISDQLGRKFPSVLCHLLHVCVPSSVCSEDIRHQIRGHPDPQGSQLESLITSENSSSSVELPFEPQVWGAILGPPQGRFQL